MLDCTRNRVILRIETIVPSRIELAELIYITLQVYPLKSKCPFAKFFSAFHSQDTHVSFDLNLLDQLECRGLAHRIGRVSDNMAKNTFDLVPGAQKSRVLKK